MIPAIANDPFLYLLLDKTFSSEDSDIWRKPYQDTQLAREKKLQGDRTNRVEAIIIIRPVSFYVADCRALQYSSVI